MRYVACVSYPRSGHHLTVRILSHYFGRTFNYCQYYGRSTNECCGQFPCVNPDIHLTKNHDVQLDQRWPRAGVPKVASTPYLILIRNFLEAVVSDYNLFLRGNEDSPAAWRRFSQRKLRYYRRFVRKWVTDTDGLEKCVVHYEELTADPSSQFRRILRFIDPDQPINERRLARLVENATLEDVRPDGVQVVPNFGVQNRRRLEEFQHFDPVYFARLEHQLAADLKVSGYRLRFAG